MRYGLISDIHGNLEALEAVMKELDKLDVDEVLCLGDVIGYGPDPEKCLEVVRERAKIILAGNHDHAPLGLVDISYFNSYAKRAVEWTAVQLSEASRRFLESRPLKHVLDNFTIVHATPANPAAWEYILSVDDAIENFPFVTGRCCFIGHSHVPVVIVREVDERVRVLRATNLTLEDDSRYIINIGSVGQPRDLDPRAAFAVYDNESFDYQLHRVSYEIGRTQRKILERGLPPFLAERLALGQ